MLGADDVRRAITRMAHEIIERNHGLDGVVLSGCSTAASGWPSARRRDRPDRAPGARRSDRRVAVPRRHRAAAGRARPVERASRSTSTAPPSCSSTTCSTPAAPCGPPSTRSSDYGRPARRPARRAGRPRPPRAADPARLRRQEPAHQRRPRTSSSTADGVVIVPMKHLRSIAEIGVDGHPAPARPHRPHGRGQPPAQPEGAGAARQDRVQRVLRGLDPHPAVSFETAAKRLSADTMTFAVGVVERQQGREPARHDRDDRGDGRRRVRRSATGRAACRGRSAAGRRRA